MNESRAARRTRRNYNNPEVVRHYGRLESLTDAERLLVDRHVTPGAHVLDLGVGGGRTVSALSSRAGAYIGVDYSPAMIAHCKQRFPDADLRVLDASDLSVFADASFDVVVFSFNGLDCLHPYDKRMACVREMHRVLAPGGVAIVSSHNARSLVWELPEAAGPRGKARARLIQLRATPRKLLTALISPAPWRGHGYMGDATTEDAVLFAATPRFVENEFASVGFRLRDRLPSTHPRRRPVWETGWYYYAFVKHRG